jgi:hypothetical protein
VSGHGVNPTCIGGACLSSLVLGLDDRWTKSALCRRELPRLPPEPFRWTGASLIRRAIIACEEAEEQGRRPGMMAGIIGALPRLLGLRIGVR